MKKALIFLSAIALFSCEQKVSQSQQKPVPAPIALDSLYGNWLISEYFEPLDSPGYMGSLSVSHLGLTELVISPRFQDSILFINEDLEASMEKIEMVSKDTIRLSFTDAPYNLLTYNPTSQMLQYQIDERYPVYHFFKAPDSLVDDASHSAFRKKLNTYLTKIIYQETGDNRYPESRSKIVFTKEGKVNGIKDYTEYRLIVNGDLNNIQDANRIELTNAKTRDSYGLKLTPNGFDLYFLKLLTLPDEKPVYKTDKLFKSYSRREY